MLRFRVFHKWIGFCLKLRTKFNFVPHPPTLFLSFIFWWFYQVYTCGYLAFVEENALLQILYTVLVCGGIGMTAASVYATTLQPYPVPPKKFAISADFDTMTPAEKNLAIKEIIRKSGVNSFHVKRVCGTCRIVRPERAHHCAICNVCTPRMDHHCVALHKCIHYKNQKQFVLFFFWMCFSLACALISFYPYVMHAYTESKGSSLAPSGPINSFITSHIWFYSHYLGKKHSAHEAFIVCLALSSMLAYFLLAIFSFVFCSFMWFCVIRGGTIVDCNKATRLGGKFGIYFVNSNARCFRKRTILENIQQTTTMMVGYIRVVVNLATVSIVN